VVPEPAQWTILGKWTVKVEKREFDGEFGTFRSLWYRRAVSQTKVFAGGDKRKMKLGQTQEDVLTQVTRI
jgi:hypothetical protein